MAAAGMAVIVEALDRVVTAESLALRLAILVTAGVASYGALVLLVAKPVLMEVIALLRPGARRAEGLAV